MSSCIDDSVSEDPDEDGASGDARDVDGESGDAPRSDGGAGDAASTDLGARDGALLDGAARDAGSTDGAARDAASTDLGARDAASADGAARDAAVPVDASPPGDAARSDGAAIDAALPDASGAACGITVTDAAGNLVGRCFIPDVPSTCAVLAECLCTFPVEPMGFGDCVTAILMPRALINLSDVCGSGQLSLGEVTRDPVWRGTWDAGRYDLTADAACDGITARM